MSSIFNYQIEANRDVEQIATENLIFLKKVLFLMNKIRQMDIKLA